MSGIPFYERPYNIEQDDKIWFKSDKKPFKVMCRSNRYVVCTKPFNARHTVLYTIIDWERNQRGRDNCYGLGYETELQCLRALESLVSNDAELSYRYCVQLDIEKVIDWRGKEKTYAPEGGVVRGSKEEQALFATE